jgi:4-hydroxy-tetrahydrodipicolinate reductase
MSAPATTPVRAVLVGVTGRMGRALVRAAADFPALRISGAIAAAGSAALGQDAGTLAGCAPLGVRVSGALEPCLAGADVVIDFSRPEALPATLAACRAAHRPLLVGTTGWPAQAEEALGAAAADIALLVAANTSLAVAVLTELTRRAAELLPRQFSVSIIERHHAGKRDAPSGTARVLAAAAESARAGGPVPVHSVREGELVGEHDVLFSGPGESLTLAHRALDRSLFARGALAAALWLSSQPAGRYGMRDLLYGKTGT